MGWAIISIDIFVGWLVRTKITVGDEGLCVVLGEGALFIIFILVFMLFILFQCKAVGVVFLKKSSFDLI